MREELLEDFLEERPELKIYFKDLHRSARERENK